jgi:hypothetical protein
MVKGQERRFIIQHGQQQAEAKEARRPIFAIFRVQTSASDLGRQRIGQGEKGMHSQESWSQAGMFLGSLSQSSFEVPFFFFLSSSRI